MTRLTTIMASTTQHCSEGTDEWKKQERKKRKGGRKSEREKKRGESKKVKTLNNLSLIDTY